MILSKKLDEIFSDSANKMRLALELGIHLRTVERWFRKEQYNFYNLTVCDAITKLFDMKLEEMFEPEETIN